MSLFDRQKDEGLNANVRPGGLNVRGQQKSLFPFDAFQFPADPASETVPRITLKTPWQMDGNIVGGQLISDDYQEGVEGLIIDLDNNVARIERLIGQVQSGDEVASADYVAGSTGWAIKGDGSAEFSDITARGVIEAQSGDIGGWTIGASSLTGGSLTLAGAGSITGPNFTLDGSGLAITGGTINIGSGQFVVTSGGALTAQSATITGDITAESGELQTLDIVGTLSVGAGGSITGTGYTLEDTGGTIGGWAIGADTLESANGKTILDQANNRLEIQDSSSNTKVVVGYLGGVGTWTSNDYGVYVAPGNNLVIEGGGDWKDGDYMIQHDAAFVIENGVGTELGRFGSLGAGEIGLRIPGAGLLQIGDYAGAGNSLEWDGTNLTINGGGTFSGALSAATGTFAGALSAATGTFSGDITAATGTFSGSLGAGIVDTAQLVAGAVTTDKLEANAVEAAKIAAGAITTGKIAAGAVTANEIAANAITAAKIAADTITADELALAENFVFTGSVGSETAASPSDGDTRAHLGKDPAGAQGASDPLELAIRGYNGQDWEYLARIFAESSGKKAHGLVLGKFNAAEALGSKFGKFWYQADIGGTEPNYSGAVAYDGSDIIVFGTSGANTYYSKSTDKGLTWSNWASCSATAPNTSVRPTDATSPAPGVFIATLRGPDAPLLRTADGGTSFSVLDPIAGSSNVLMWGIAAGDTYTVAVGADGGVGGNPTILYSNDDGATWSSVSTTTFGASGDIKGVGFGNGRFIAVGYDGTNAHVAYADETNITSWTEITTHSFSATVEAAEYTEGVWNLCGDNGEAAYSKDDGSTWTHTDPGTVGDNFTEMLAFDRQIIIQDFNAGPVHRSVDNGRTWELFDSMPAYFGDFAVIDSERVIAPMSLDGPVYISGWTEAGAGIIERGENANGEYVKHSDGTMVCWRYEDSNIATDGASSFYWTLPTAFIDNMYMAMGAWDSSTLAMGIARLELSQCTTTQARMRTSQTSGNISDVNLIAHGRWK